METDCIFCKIVKGEIPAEKIFDEENFIVIPDANPKAPGHHLIITKNHFENILDMPSSLGTELISIIKKTAEKTLKEQQAQGFNVLINNFEPAGQSIKHTHIHIIPRKKDDDLPMVA